MVMMMVLFFRSTQKSATTALPLISGSSKLSLKDKSIQWVLIALRFTHYPVLDDRSAGDCTVGESYEPLECW